MPKKSIITCILFLLTVLVHSQEFRSGIEIQFPVMVFDVKTKIEPRWFYADKTEKAVIAQIGIEYDLFKNLELSAGYRHFSMIDFHAGEIERIDDEDKTRFTIDAGWETNRFDSDIKLDNRLRWQKVLSNDGEHQMYIRERLGLDYKISKEFSPTLATEVYYHLKKNKITTYRLLLGNDIELGHSGLEFSYIFEFNPGKTDKKSYYILGITYKRDF